MSEMPNPQMIMEILLDLQQSQRDMRDEMRAGFTRLDDRMTGLERRMDRLEERMDRLDERMARFEERVDRIEGRQDAMETLLRQQTQRLDMLTLDVANLRRDLAALRTAVHDYHGAVIGHGVHITELDERLRRIEKHLGLSRI